MANDVLQGMISAFASLPGIGPKTAQRIAFFLLNKDEAFGRNFLTNIDQALATIRRCNRCRHFCAQEECHFCTSSNRDQNTLCVVHYPSDLLLMEQSDYNGLYFVLHGAISPIDRIGIEDVGIDHLQKRLHQEPISEVILALHSTIEGDLTMRCIERIAVDVKQNRPLKLSRLSQGVPFGRELEFVDQRTLSMALKHRQLI